MTEERVQDSNGARWRAVEARDASCDGAFVYAVRTTGVYCRPSCPARRPRRENVLFFAGPEDAEAAGFRACRRCAPGEVDARARVVARVRALVDRAVAEGEAVPPLAELARAVDLSPFHLQRLFKRAVGLSPKQYALRARTERLKANLRGGANVTAALFDAGHPSARTVYDRATDQLGMTPGAYRTGGEGQMIAYDLIDSPLGDLLVAATPRGLCAVHFGEGEALAAALREEYPRADVRRDPAAVAPYAAALREHLAGHGPALALPTDVAATDFQRRVWAALAEIPVGETRTYKEVAERLGEPSAARAVARACATNPTALVVPCHRVVRAGGALAGYRWGVERKRRLLDAERERAAPTVRLSPARSAGA